MGETKPTKVKEALAQRVTILGVPWTAVLFFGPRGLTVASLTAPNSAEAEKQVVRQMDMRSCLPPRMTITGQKGIDLYDLPRGAKRLRNV